MIDIAGRLAGVRAQVALAARRAGRDPGEITLVGVAKRQPLEQVVEAVAAGLTDLAESFAQEARDKLPRVNEALAARGLSRPRWHFVGQLQRNKVRLVAPLFDCVASLDRESLADELERRAAALGRHLEVLIQIDISGETRKGGVDPAQALGLLRHVDTLGSLSVAGLMAVPAAADDPEAARPAFARLRALRDELRQASGWPLPVLSMGMSGDFAVAIDEGATQVRVGTAIFGQRPSAQAH